MTAELEVMQPQTKDCLEPPEAGRAFEGSCLRAFVGHGPAGTLTSYFLSPNGRRITFCCFKPPCLWYFITELSCQVASVGSGWVGRRKAAESGRWKSL